MPQYSYIAEAMVQGLYIWGKREIAGAFQRVSMDFRRVPGGPRDASGGLRGFHGDLAVSRALQEVSGVFSRGLHGVSGGF